MRDSNTTRPAKRLVRLRRLRARALDEMVDAVVGGHAPMDPGLRERFMKLPRAPIRLIAPKLSKDVNQGGLLRIADAFRLEGVDLEEVERTERDLRGAVGARAWQPHRWIEPLDAIAEARSRGFTIYGLSLRPGAVVPEAVEWRFPSALVVGQEQEGMADAIAEACDALVAIPMFGMVDSLNVSVSAGIVVNQMIQAYRRLHPDYRPARAASLRLFED